MTNFQDVKLNMTDLLTSKKVTRIIDITNLMSSGDYTWELLGEDDQKKNLENWIQERGNEQHEAILALDSWEIITY